jgi:hypothetical protein
MDGLKFIDESDVASSSLSPLQSINDRADLLIAKYDGFPTNRPPGYGKGQVVRFDYLRQLADELNVLELQYANLPVNIQNLSADVANRLNHARQVAFARYIDNIIDLTFIDELNAFSSIGDPLRRLHLSQNHLESLLSRKYKAFNPLKSANKMLVELGVIWGQYQNLSFLLKPWVTRAMTNWKDAYDLRAYLASSQLGPGHAALIQFRDVNREKPAKTLDIVPYNASISNGSEYLTTVYESTDRSSNNRQTFTRPAIGWGQAARNALSSAVGKTALALGGSAAVIGGGVLINNLLASAPVVVATPIVEQAVNTLASSASFINPASYALLAASIAGLYALIRRKGQPVSVGDTQRLAADMKTAVSRLSQKSSRDSQRASHAIGPNQQAILNAQLDVQESAAHTSKAVSAFQANPTANALSYATQELAGLVRSVTVAEEAERFAVAQSQLPIYYPTIRSVKPKPVSTKKPSPNLTTRGRSNVTATKRRAPTASSSRSQSGARSTVKPKPRPKPARKRSGTRAATPRPKASTRRRK